MTKSELKQKLEAKGKELSISYATNAGELSLDKASIQEIQAYKAGYSALQMLLLDAYEALEFYKDCTKDSFGDGNSYAEDDGAKAFKALARIEAFANGEK